MPATRSINELTVIVKNKDNPKKDERVRLDDYIKDVETINKVNIPIEEVKRNIDNYIKDSNNVFNNTGYDENGDPIPAYITLYSNGFKMPPIPIHNDPIETKKRIEDIIKEKKRKKESKLTKEQIEEQRNNMRTKKIYFGLAPDDPMKSAEEKARLRKILLLALLGAVGIAVTAIVATQFKNWNPPTGNGNQPPEPPPNWYDEAKKWAEKVKEDVEKGVADYQKDSTYYNTAQDILAGKQWNELTPVQRSETMRLVAVGAMTGGVGAGVMVGADAVIESGLADKVTGTNVKEKYHDYQEQKGEAYDKYEQSLYKSRDASTKHYEAFKKGDQEGMKKAQEEFNQSVNEGWNNATEWWWGTGKKK